MAKLIWRFQAIFYNGFRRNPVSSHILKTENEAIIRMIETLPKNTIGKVLDLGSGSGNSLTFLHFGAGMITALDYSLPMLRYTKRFFPYVFFLNGNACVLPVKENRFDLVMGIGLLEYIRDMEGFFHEIYRVLKPAGYVIFTVSPPVWQTNLRRILGHKIYARKNSQVAEILNKHSFILLKRERTWLQQQYLVQKHEK
jgi:ubiquinone/menaquinone biosynthesis C-methylase UbiE